MSELILDLQSKNRIWFCWNLYVVSICSSYFEPLVRRDVKMRPISTNTSQWLKRLFSIPLFYNVLRMGRCTEKNATHTHEQLQHWIWDKKNKIPFPTFTLRFFLCEKYTYPKNHMSFLCTQLQMFNSSFFDFTKLNETIVASYNVFWIIFYVNFCLFHSQIPISIIYLIQIKKIIFNQNRGKKSFW